MSSSRTLVARRYAKALFALAKAKKSFEVIESDLKAFQEILEGSKELQQALFGPLLSRKKQADIVEAVLKKAKADTLTVQFFAVVAANRRLDCTREIAKAFAALLREERGELAAEVVSAVALKAAQVKSLEASLKSSLGKKVEVSVSVDEKLLGGLVIKLGSTMLDGSLANKLERLRVVGKESVANIG